MRKLTLTLFTALIATAGAMAQNCFPEWEFYRDITVDNTGNMDTLNDYQVKVVMNTGQLVTDGKLQASGSDLRFSDTDCNPLHFYMDSAATSAQNVIWVKVPVIPADTTIIIQVYYGYAPAPSVANGDSTFIFFDDFEDGAVDANKWTLVGSGSMTESSGALTYAAGNTWPTSSYQFMQSDMVFASPVVIETGLMQNTSSGLAFIKDGSLERYFFRTMSNADDSLRTAYATDTTSGTIYADTEYPKVSTAFNGAGDFADLLIRTWINANNHIEITEFTNVNTGQSNTTTKELMQFTMNGFRIGFTGFQSNNTISSDYIKVRQSVTAEPSATVGSEGILTGIKDQQCESRVRVSPNPNNGQFRVDLSQVSGLAEITIVDIAGRVVKSNVVNGGAAVDVSMDADSGVYFLSVKGAGISQVSRIVVR